MLLKRSSDDENQPPLNAQIHQQLRSQYESPTPDAPCPFFTLPRELRDEIYHFALGNLGDAFMYGKAQVRATYQGHKGVIKGTYRQQLWWMCTTRQLHEKATDQLYRLARFELDFDMRHELLYSGQHKLLHSGGFKVPKKVSIGLKLTRARHLVVVNADMYFDYHSKHLRSLTNLLPRMHALRSLSINIKLVIPSLDQKTSIDCKP
jgi:hypothetical protein